LQRSWEMFELAKLIYQKNFNDDQQLKNKRIAECLLKLGEISIEQEIYDQATTDIRECIRMQEEQSERDERMLAESYYQLGLAQQFNNLFSEATESYQRSINILQIRVEKLKGKLLTIALEGDDAQLERNTINDEIAELETLLPELNGKLEEVNEQGQQSLNLIKEAKECFINSMNGNSNELNGKPINGNGECKDITSLMKSKRKISSSDDVSNLKKTRLSANGNELINNEAAPVEESAEAKIDIDDKENGTVAPVAETTEEKRPEENGNVEMGEKEESKPVESNQAEPAKVEENCA
jgi:nuclear autoantigenic sperm protein